MLCFPIAVLGQNRSIIDSLSRSLKNSSDKQFEILNALGWEYRFSKPDSTIYYAKMAYELGKKLNLQKDLAKPLNYIGVAINYKGDKIKAFECYQQAVAVAEKQNDTIQLAYTNNNIGRLLFEQGLLPKSFNYFVTSLNLFKRTADSSGIAYVKQSLGNLHRLQKDFKKAEQEHLGALGIRLRLKNQRDVMSAYVQLGVLFQEQKELLVSTHYFLKADSIGKVTKDLINLAEVKVLLAENYLAEGKVLPAEVVGMQGFKVIAANNNARMLPRTLLLVGRVQKAKKEYAQARSRFSEALAVARNTQSSAFQIESHLQLAELAKVMGNRQEEISNMNQYLLLKDSVEDLELVRKVERLQFEIQIQSKEKENEFLKMQQARTHLEVERQRIANILTIVVSGFALLLAGVAFYIGYKARVTNLKLAAQNMLITAHQREIDQQYEALKRKNSQLSDSNNEKDTLMSIVAHDLKVPFNQIAGLISLIEMDGKLNLTQLDYVSKIKEVTQSSTGLIVDLLDVHAIESERNVPMPQAFNLVELVQERVESFRLVAAQKKIKIEFNSGDLPLVISDPNYVGRVLDNLLSNAIKFSPAEKKVFVTLKLSESMAMLVVKDEGPGFSQADKALLFQKFKKLSARPTAGESSNGLGLAIVKILVDRLKGSVRLVSGEGCGSEFVVSIPIAA
ncbi:MAG: ATP-binding protein [Cytophagales bacterium]